MTAVKTHRNTTHSAVLRSSWLLLGVVFCLAIGRVNAEALPNFAKIVEESGKAVVKITATTNAPNDEVAEVPPGLEEIPERFRRFFEQGPQGKRAPRPGQGFGSGFIIDTEGHVLTNHHVIDGADEVSVSLPDQREFAATIIGSDPRTDVALLKIDGDDLPTVELGDSDSLRVGQWVLAIGSPFSFEYSATQGIVSALSRALPDESYVPFIQTDVAVNPGNSGGPLFDTDGKVVGINSQIYTRSGAFMGLSFAIPINLASQVAEQLRDQGYVSRGWLGVLIQQVDPSLAESFGLDRPKGALVSRLFDNSPAAAAGVQVGDVIIEFDGNDVPDSSGLPPLVGRTDVGNTVEMIVMRDAQRLSLSVTIGELEEERVAQQLREPAKPSNSIGLRVIELDEQEREELQVQSGVRVEAVGEGSVAQIAGIEPGDLILKFNRQSINTSEELDSAIEGTEPGKTVPVLLWRAGSPLFIPFTVE